jgi:hypothetical protein
LSRPPSAAAAVMRCSDSDKSAMKSTDLGPA